MPSRPSGTREIAREAVRKQITDVAKELFAEQGYEGTTIDDIAAAIGISQRTVFRYFPTKEAIVVGKIDYFGDDFLAALRDRPVDEATWESLRRGFDCADPEGDPGDKDVAVDLHRIVFGAPALLGTYLETLQRMQDAAGTILRERAAAAGSPYPKRDPTPDVIAAGAFGCLVAAQRSWLAGGAKGSFAEMLDRAMATIAPTTAPRRR